MADICRSCTMRAQRSALSALRRQAQTQTRSFTSTAAALKSTSIPTFTETSSPDLDAILVQLRTKHFMPAYLTRNQRTLVSSPKFGEEVVTTSTSAAIRNEESSLKNVDSRTTPSRNVLVAKAMELIRENGEWEQLPALLEGLYRVRSGVDFVFQEKVLRRLTEADRFEVIVQCLKDADKTGLTLKHDRILNPVLWALRVGASKDGWSDKKRMEDSLQYARDFAAMLESKEHGTGKPFLLPNDPRARPEVIALWLELYAVYALQHQQGADVDGKVKMYAERLMSSINQSNQPAEEPLPPFGMPTEFCKKMSIWHGLNVAKSILRNDMPQSQRANEIITTHGNRLEELAQGLRGQNRGYAKAALAEWDACIRP